MIPMAGDLIWADTHYRRVTSIENVDDGGKITLWAYDTAQDAIVKMSLSPKEVEPPTQRKHKEGGRRHRGCPDCKLCRERDAR